MPPTRTGRPNTADLLRQPGERRRQPAPPPSALQAGMNVWNTQARFVVPLPVRRHRHRTPRRLRQPQRGDLPQRYQRRRDRHHLLVVGLEQPAARQRHHLLGRRLQLLHRHVRLRRRVQRRLHRGRRGARVRARARPEPLESHRRHDVSELQLLLAGVPHARAGRYRRRPRSLSGGSARPANTAPAVTINEPGQRRQLRRGHHQWRSPARPPTRRTAT